MSAVNIEFPGNLAQVSSIANLRLVPSAFVFNETVYLVSNVGLYTYDAASFAVDDGASVIMPADHTVLQAGRWLAVLAPGNFSDQTHRASLGDAAAYRTLSDKANDRFDLRDVEGVDLTGNNSSRAALQKAFDVAAAEGTTLYIPAGKIVADATLNITNTLSVSGDHLGIGRAIAGYDQTAPIGPSSRIHFAHGGVGIQMTGAGASFDGVSWSHLMFSRDQPPVPTSGTWEPNDHDYDMVMFGMAGLYLNDVLFLNPTRGINMLGGGTIGRLHGEQVRMQAMVVGVNVELAADSVNFEGFKQWPFWQDHVEVNRWTINNCDAFFLKRCDSPMFTNFNSIATRSAFRIGKNEFGSVTKMKVSNYDIDYSQYCIWFDSTSQNAWARFSNGTLQANNSNGTLSNTPPSVARQNLKMDGVACHVMFDGLEISGASGTGIDLGADGKNNYCEVSSDFWVQNYGETPGNTDPCIRAGAGSTFVRHGYVKDTSLATGPLIGGPGRFIGIRKAYSAGISAQFGTYTTLALIDSEFIEDGYVITGTVNISVVNAGTATGYMDVTLPTELDISYGMTASDGTDATLLSVRSIAGTPAVARITKPGSGNVGVTGHVINLTFTYVRKAV